MDGETRARFDRVDERLGRAEGPDDDVRQRFRIADDRLAGFAA